MGFLFLVGRIKEQINRGGEKISPLEIDQVRSSQGWAGYEDRRLNNIIGAAAASWSSRSCRLPRAKQCLWTRDRGSGCSQRRVQGQIERSGPDGACEKEFSCFQGT